MKHKNHMVFFQVFLLISASFVISKLTYAQERLLTNKTLHTIQGYAVASCLTEQEDPILKDQGYRWAEAIIQSSNKYDFEMVLPVFEAVKKEIPNNDMYMIRDELNPQQAKALPVYYCYDIVLKPSVQSAIFNAYTRLKK